MARLSMNDPKDERSDCGADDIGGRENDELIAGLCEEEGPWADIGFLENEAAMAEEARREAEY